MEKKLYLCPTLLLLLLLLLLLFADMLGHVMD